VEVLQSFSDRFYVMSPAEAEIVKVSINTFYAMKVTYANTVYDLCSTHGADYEQVRRAMESDRFIAPNHLDVKHKGYRGYGGKCLPKDVNIFLRVADSPLIMTVQTENGKWI